jgi:hypothetical protein
MEEEGTTYLYIKHNNLILLAVVDVNASAAMILLYLYQVVEVSCGLALFWHARVCRPFGVVQHQQAHQHQSNANLVTYLGTVK